MSDSSSHDDWVASVFGVHPDSYQPQQSDDSGGGILDSVSSAASSAVDAVGSAASSAANVLADGASAVASTVADGASAVASTAETALEFQKGLVEGVYEGGKGLVTGVVHVAEAVGKEGYALATDANARAEAVEAVEHGAEAVG